MDLLTQQLFMQTPTPQNLKQIIDSLGYATNLGLVLDAGDITSYPGTGQTFFDLSGGSQNFYLGGTSSATTDDPTFNGNAGGLSANEFFSFDGGDDFIETSTSINFAETWNNDNAVATLIFFGRLASTTNYILSNHSSNSTTGVDFGVSTAVSSDKVGLTVGNNGSASLNVSSTASVTYGADLMVSFAINEATGANGLRLQINGSESLHTSTYISPSALASASPYRIGSRGGGTSKMPSGSRLYAMAAWSRQLSKAEIDAIYAQMKLRLTSLP